MPTVREASGNDVEACVSIVRGLPEFFTDDVPATVRRDLVRDRAWVVEDESVIGFAIARERFAGAAEITWAAVENGRRHVGFGTKLIERVLDDLLARGTHIVEVKTLDDSAPYEPYVATRRFWENRGFVKVDVIDPLPGWQPGNPSAIYVLALAPTRSA